MNRQNFPNWKKSTVRVVHHLHQSRKWCSGALVTYVTKFGTLQKARLVQLFVFNLLKNINKNELHQCTILHQRCIGAILSKAYFCTDNCTICTTPPLGGGEVVHGAKRCCRWCGALWRFDLTHWLVGRRKLS